MLTYKGRTLTKFKNKKGGKNQGEVDGFYRDPDGGEFFVKKPRDPKELFTELFSGLLLQEFKRRELIDNIYHNSLICAELIQFEDGSYGLIQPKVVFKELYKIIGTGYRDGSDRDPLVEMFCGPQFYLFLTQLRSYYGLAIALMFSLLLGDNSVHSGNVVCLDVISSVEMKFIQFARIDWGAAFRYFGHKKNNDELLYPFEYQGWFNPKGYTKGYFLNYKRIKGLFPAIAEQASILQKKVNEELLVDMVFSVLRQLPSDLVESKTRFELAKYLCIESFNSTSFGEEGDFQQFSRDLVGILYSRLKKITAIHDFSIATAGSDLSQIMYVESILTAISLPVNMVTPFAEQMNIWLNMLSSSDERSIFDFNHIDQAALAKQFNYFMESLLRQAGRLNQYVDDDHATALSSTIPPDSESCFLRGLFTLETDLTPNSSSYTEERKPYQHAYWHVIETVLNTSFNALITVRVLQNTQNSTQFANASAIHFLCDALKECLKTFSVVYQKLIKELEEALSLMSGAQLARICFNEMEFMSSSLFIGMVLKSPVLWAHMNKAFDDEFEVLYQEKAAHKIADLRKFHEDFTLFEILVSELPLITTFDTKGVLINEISRLFANLPEFLQTELAATLNNIQGEFREWHRRLSIDLEEQGKFNEEFNLSPKNSNIDYVALENHQSQQTVQSEVLFGKMNTTSDVSRNATNRLFFFSLPEASKLSLPVDESLDKNRNIASTQ